MIGQFFLGAYWPARRESIEQCADRLQQLFAGLVACDSALATWYETGRSRKQALQKRADVENRDYLLKLLDCGRHRRDVGRTVMEDLGFRIGLWNGGDEGNDAGLGIGCGLYSTVPGIGGNCITMDFPENLGDLKRAERMARVLSVVAEAWEPDWAGIMSNGAKDTRNFSPKTPFVDWMLYLSNNLAPQIPKLPHPASVQQLGKIGSLVVVQPEPPDPANPDHLRNIQQVEATLRPAPGARVG